MSKTEYKIIFSDGSESANGDYPVAVKSVQKMTFPEEYDNEVIDPIFSHHISRNLYGRIMTLVEATTDNNRLKAVKNLFSKELVSWENDVYSSAREIASGGGSSHNLYTRNDVTPSNE